MKGRDNKLLIVDREKEFEAYKVFARDFPVHGHANYLIMLVTSGEGQQLINGNVFNLKAGVMIMMSPCDFHQNMVSENPVEYYGLQFSPSFLNTRLQKLSDYGLYPLVGELKSAEMESAEVLFKMLIEEQRLPNKKASDAYVQSAIELLALKAFRQCQTFNSDVSSNTNLRKAMTFIHEHFREPIMMNAVASYTGYSESHFSVKFKQAIGIPFQEYICSLRLHYAKNLLASSNYSITECAFNSGFNSVAYFSNKFKKKFRCSPSEYRTYAGRQHS